MHDFFHALVVATIMVASFKLTAILCDLLFK